MAIYYSAIEGKRGFYDSDIHAVIPEGAVEITAEEHKNLLQAALDQNKIITPNENGYPTLTDRPAPTAPTASKLIEIANANIKKQITVIESNRQPRALREATLTGDLTRLTEIENEITALRAQLQ